MPSTNPFSGWVRQPHLNLHPIREAPSRSRAQTNIQSSSSLSVEFCCVGCPTTTSILISTPLSPRFNAFGPGFVATFSLCTSPLKSEQGNSSPVSVCEELSRWFGGYSPIIWIQHLPPAPLGLEVVPVPWLGGLSLGAPCVRVHRGLLRRAGHPGRVHF